MRAIDVRNCVALPNTPLKINPHQPALPVQPSRADWGGLGARHAGDRCKGLCRFFENPTKDQSAPASSAVPTTEGGLGARHAGDRC